MKLNEGFLAQMREATELLRSSGPMAATAAIQRALHGAAPNTTAQQVDWTAFLPQQPELRDINPAPAKPDPASNPAADILARLRKMGQGKWKGMSALQPVQDIDPDIDLAGKGRYLSGSCSNRAGTRAYKLYVPSSYREQGGEALPLIVMLHGCKQHPDDFAVGTGMNTVAEENNCFVVYPAQMQGANGSNCWNWFKPEDQRRDGGEPSIIADMTREIIRTYNIDPARVYVAGLSAGGAMAAIMGATYPELYAAVGVHSGLPYGAAHDLPSAFASMRGGKGKAEPQGIGAKAPASLEQSIPIIVFHGDRDTTVHPSNGDQVLAQCTSPSRDTAHQPEHKVEKGAAPNGRTYTRSIRLDREGRAVAEHWVVHGAGHAWSGGSGKGSYTDPKGPDASREMLRFFRSHSRGATRA
ncbi:PHB depolymerase family esterase [Noviherbaspirillum sp.]|uniref:extracellular catalytic domain type 1 short-chain-length polyhydroxyalkanoate depolymerase n=1 Tax=Noviherbaspirillum sp. TaxID=1926288 RepID=UPI002B47B48C|nr:PHB depolymerase family esterase [Noviherbaspirillum sp.]HJV83028.1 PHB depolymerase family esterase [Noviherbaspirillum sp.]